MRRKLAFLFVPALLAGLLVGIGGAQAHQCEQTKKNKPAECRDTEVYPDWRPNYIPLFDLPNRDDPEAGQQERYDAQRWRDECDDDDDGDGVEDQRQQCQWLYGGTSVMPDEGTDGDPEAAPYGLPLPPLPVPRPNELHVGYAANHCFLAEGAHDCDSHAADEFGTHDSHGGAVYADVCLSTNPDSRLCDDGLSDTQVGVTIVDHLTCPLGCFDEYHVVRPFDLTYTQDQMGDSATAVGAIAGDPKTYACGDPDHSYCTDPTTIVPSGS